MPQEKTNLSAELEERLNFETLIAEISSKFVDLPASEVDREIENALRHVCEPLGIDLAVLWQWSGAAPRVLLSYTNNEVEPSGPADYENCPKADWIAFSFCCGRIK